MKYPPSEQPALTDGEPDRELAAYLMSTGLSVSPKITRWWRALSPEQRRGLLEQAFDPTERSTRRAASAGRW